MFDESDIIHRYSRAQALADGVLIDVSSTAREAGFTFPVALTAAAWAKCVTVPPGVVCQDEAGRLWDVLTLLRFTFRRSTGDGTEVRFAVHVRNDNLARTPPLVRLKALCGPGTSDPAQPDQRPAPSILAGAWPFSQKKGHRAASTRWPWSCTISRWPKAL
jgi:hypothetical protein